VQKEKSKISFLGGYQFDCILKRERQQQFFSTKGKAVIFVLFCFVYYLFVMSFSLTIKKEKKGVQ
jgi:hypothetical protein